MLLYSLNWQHITLTTLWWFSRIIASIYQYNVCYDIYITVLDNFKFTQYCCHSILYLKLPQIENKSNRHFVGYILMDLLLFLFNFRRNEILKQNNNDNVCEKSTQVYKAFCDTSIWTQTNN